MIENSFKLWTGGVEFANMNFQRYHSGAWHLGWNQKHPCNDDGLTTVEREVPGTLG